MLCRKCHNELEDLIPVEYQMPVNWYYWVVEDYIRTKRQQRNYYETEEDYGICYVFG